MDSLTAPPSAASSAHLPPHQAGLIDARVAAIQDVARDTKIYTLARVDGARLPAYAPGAHIDLHLPNGLVRQFSLVAPNSDPKSYVVGVKRDAASRGGSRYIIDEMRVGDQIKISAPRNTFPLVENAEHVVLIAGGIGITPFLAQLEDLHGGGVPYEMHYSVRSAEHAAFLERLRRREGERLHMYYDSEAQLIPFEPLLASQPLGTHVYVCGPAGMINHVIATARSCGWPDSHIHWEQFSAPPVGDAFEVFLARSNLSVHVPPDQSLLESIEAAGVEVPYLCRGGVCGFCHTRVLELDGELLHNDHFLSDADKAKGTSIMPCVSRAHCKRLVLDL
jgi:ferredoxin-NADP reductase